MVKLSGDTLNLKPKTLNSDAGSPSTGFSFHAACITLDAQVPTCEFGEVEVSAKHSWDMCGLNRDFEIPS